MPNAATIARDESLDVAPGRRPGDFDRNHQGAPWVAHPTETTKPTGTKADLIVQCAGRGITVPPKATVAQLHALLGARPRRVLYGRPSSLGKQIENTTNLQKWSERAVALGLHFDGGDLLAPLDALGPEHWNLDDAAASDVLDGIAVKAKTRAQAGIAADRGTHGHALTEDYDLEGDWVARVSRGEQLGLSRDVQTALVAAWEKAAAMFGFDMLAVEATCVDDLWRQAGTLDRIVRLTRALRFVTALGEIVELPAGWVGILDLKTGKLRIDERTGFLTYWHSYAVQLASYAQSVPYDPDSDTRSEWPWPIDQRWAIIAHLDILAALDGEAACRLVLVDLEAGREAGLLCVAAREWEKRGDVFSIVTDELTVRVPVRSSDGDTLPPVVEQRAGEVGDASPANIDPAASNPPQGQTGEDLAANRPSPVTVAALDAPPASSAEAQPAPEATGTAEPPASGATSVPGDVHAVRRRALLDRYQQLNVDQQRAYCALKVPAADLDAVEAALNRVDPFAHESPPPPPRPRPTDTPRDAPATPDEGGQCDSQAVATLRRHYEALAAEARAWVDSLVSAGKTAGVPWNTGGAHTLRRFELGRAVVTLAPVAERDTVARGLLVEATGRDALDQPTLPLGAAIGTLDAAEAQRFAQLADDYVALGATA